MPNDPCVDAANTALRDALDALWAAIIECFESNPVAQSWADAHALVRDKWIEQTYPELIAAAPSACPAIIADYETSVASAQPTNPTSACLEKAWQDFQDAVVAIRDQLLDCLGLNP